MRVRHIPGVAGQCAYKVYSWWNSCGHLELGFADLREVPPMLNHPSAATLEPERHWFEYAEKYYTEGQHATFARSPLK